MPPVRALAFSSLIGGLALLLVGLVGGSALALNGFLGQPPGPNARDNLVRDHAADLMDRGRETFRNDTFGSEGFFGALGLHRAIEGPRFGGVTTALGLDGVTPAPALPVGREVGAA